MYNRCCWAVLLGMVVFHTEEADQHGNKTLYEYTCTDDNTIVYIGRYSELNSRFYIHI